MTTSIRSHPEEEDSSPPQVDPQPLEEVLPTVLHPIQHHQPGQDMPVVEISGPNDDEWVTTNPPVYCNAAYLGKMKESEEALKSKVLILLKFIFI